MAGGGAAASSSGTKKARIEIIPLIDVVFFLLATFVLFILSLNKIQSLPVNLPVAAPPSDEKPLPPVIIQVTDGDSVFWDRDPISMSEVLPKLMQYKGSTEDPRVTLSGDDRARFGTLVQVMDAVRQSGIEKVSVETAYRASGR